MSGKDEGVKKLPMGRRSFMPGNVVIARVSGVTAADSAENRPTSRSRWNSESDNDLKKKASHQGGNPI
jgi:hypothetical protein